MHQRVAKGGRRTKKVNKVKKGGYYSFAGDLGHPGAANWKSESEMGSYAISSRGGNTQFGRGRKKSKKGKKTRKAKRGGGAYGAVSASYQGTGARGIADVVGISPNKPGFATQGEFNNYGAQPGSGFGSFITTSK
jgi:hypothetical protein